MICAFDVSSASTHYFPASAVLDFQSVSFAVSDFYERNDQQLDQLAYLSSSYFSVLAILDGTRESWKHVVWHVDQSINRHVNANRTT